jgi:hypothetical protein
MFPHQQMAVGLMPREFIYCHICTWTCCDTGSSLVCAFSCGNTGGCGHLSPIEVQAAPVQAGDPVEQLKALRKRLEVTLAGVEAQEAALHKQREAGTDQKK